ncbi:MAG TPA: LPS-assembly protein LptD [Nitrospirales bacterium]|nr:LPS-assembly protein LptD [Nitrospirales bacterium]HIO21022.1 LPS-assembly protein LptD [Nitrospirales bacterium]
MSKVPHFRLSGVKHSSLIGSFFAAFLIGFVLFPCPAALASTEIASEEEPIDIHADRVEYSRTEDTYIADGNVDVIRGVQHLTSDHATLNMKEGFLVAEGNVNYDDGEQTMTADRMELSMKSKAGVVFHGTILIRESHQYLTGKVIERIDAAHYRIEDGSYTACMIEEGKRTPWQFKAKEFRLDTEGYLVAKGVQFCLLEVPVAYLPIVILPGNSERKTGLLMPSPGFNSEQGFKLKQGLFWAINPHQDVTATIDHRGDQGTGGELEYRYKLSKNTEGELRTTFFKDKRENKDRFDLQMQHNTQFTKNLQATVDIDFVNKRDTLQELSDDVEERVQRLTESRAFASQRWDHGSAYLLGRFSQDLANSDDPTSQFLPELGYRLQPYRIPSLPMYLGLESSFTNIHRQDGTLRFRQDGEVILQERSSIDARRTDLFPKLWSTFQVTDGISFTPQVGVRETLYSRGENSGDWTDRTVPYLSVEADATMSRRFRPWKGRSVTHRMTPSVTYEYLPSINQSNLPQFDDLDFVFQKNLVTYSIGNRISTTKRKGKKLEHIDLLSFTATQSVQMNPGSRTTARTVLGRPETLETRTFSDLRLEASINLPKFADLDFDAFIDPKTGTSSVFEADIGLFSNESWYLTVGQRFTRAGDVPVRGDLFNPVSFNTTFHQEEDINFTTVEGGATLPFGFRAVAKAYYDADPIDTAPFPEVDYGLFYTNPCNCWGAGLFFIQRPDRAGTSSGSDNEFGFMISLRGIGGTETNITSKFRRMFQKLGLDPVNLK